MNMEAGLPDRPRGTWDQFNNVIFPAQCNYIISYMMKGETSISTLGIPIITVKFGKSKQTHHSCPICKFNKREFQIN